MRRALFVCLVFAMACSSDELRLEDYDAKYIEAWCRYQTRCGVYQDVASCRAQDRFPVDPDLVAAIRAGTVEWHPEVAEACIAVLDDLSCDRGTAEYRYQGVPCYGALVGTLHEGDACVFGAECISRECWTENLQCAEACCRGTCEGDETPPVAHLGDRCRYAPCAEGYCEASLCVPLKPEGTQCEFDDHECDLGLGCDFDPRVGHFTCQPLAGSGERCLGATGASRCAVIDERCRNSTGRCEPGRFVGETCNDNTDCMSDLCDETSHCVDTSFTPAGLGESCMAVVDCAAPLVCDRPADSLYGTCVPAKADGDACLIDEECASSRCDALGMCSSDVCI